MAADTPELRLLGQHAAKHTAKEGGVLPRLVDAFAASPVPAPQKLVNFARSVRRQDVARFLAKVELFKLALPVHGSVVECGVFAGGGLFTWAHASAVFEPYNHTRRVIGFDTFDGFPSVAPQDTAAGTSEHLKPNAFRTHEGIRDELLALAAVHDDNRPLGHIPKVELVAGDATRTIPEYVRTNPHLLVSLVYLDFDLYEPTLVALRELLPRIPRGGVVAFDELNCADFPGETTALLEAVDIRSVRLQRLPFDPYISYFLRD